MIAKARSVRLSPSIWIGVAGIALALFAARTLSFGGAAVAAISMAVMLVGTAAAERVRPLVVRMRRTPLRARGLDLGSFVMPRPAPRLLMRPCGLEFAPVVLGVAGVAASRHNGSDTDAVVVLVVAAVLASIPVVVLGRLLLRDHRSRLRARATEAISASVGRLAPEVILYFSGSVEELYQLRMWFDPLARLERRTLVVLRSDLVMDALQDAPFPVISSTYNGPIAALPLPAKVLTLFPTHSGNNLSMIRRAESYCVFVGHGDSDKPDSVNPYARAYDEIWVAGPLGRRRYAEAAVGVRDEVVHEVGRPQLLASGGPPPQPPVVVYAPTWEGWGDDPDHSSLPHVGVALVDALLATPGVELRYRPHPLTGRRDPLVRQANAAIVARVGQVPSGESLAATLAGATALVADVSSVVAEYLPYDRPYAVADTRSLGRRALSRRFPSTSGAFLLGTDLSGLDEFVAAAVGGRDGTTKARRALMNDALGDPLTSQRRFSGAVDRVLGK